MEVLFFANCQLTYLVRCVSGIEGDLYLYIYGRVAVIYYMTVMMIITD